VTDRVVPAPGLRETAEIWWDSAADPAVTWDAAGREFRLVDGADAANALLLLRAPAPAAEPERIARVLADGLAACDFPPTGDGASPARVAATLRVAGVVLPVGDEASPRPAGQRAGVDDADAVD
jgi:hypothetical protein